VIPDSLIVRGVTVFNSHTEVDFTKLKGDIVAVTGANGAGKTTLMECVFAALYRSFPSRPAGIYQYCHGEDAKLVLNFSMGPDKYSAILTIDALRSKMEAFLVDGGAHPLAGINGKVGPYDESIEKICGRGQLILASAFSAQNRRGSFLELSKADRKVLFIRMIDAERLQRISSLAKDRFDAARIDSAKALARQTDAERRSETPRPNLESLEAGRSSLELSIQTVETELEKLKVEYHQLKAHTQSETEAKSKLLSIQRRRGAVETRLAECKRKLRDLKDLLDNEARIREAKAAVAEAEGQMELWTAKLADAHATRRDLLVQKNNYTEILSEQKYKLADAERDLGLIDSNLKRAKADAALIETVPCHAEGEFASCQFLVRAVESKEHIGELDEAHANKTALKLSILDVIRSIPPFNADLLSVADEHVQKASSEVKRLSAIVLNNSALASKHSELESSVTLRSELSAESELRAAELESVQKEESEAQDELDNVRKSFGLLSQVARKVQGKTAELESVRKQASVLDEEIGRARSTISYIDAAEIEYQKASDELRAIQFHTKSWKLLETAFGPTGIQSLEIDSAGPAVSGIVNDLLLSCFGPRFSVSFITQQLKADGSGYKDEFDIVVLDSERGRQGSIDDLSGGEKVIVSEAVSLGIALFNRIKSGISWSTLFRDEVTGALDDANAPRYIQMLRRARELGHFKRVYFIAHQPRLQDLADSRIHISNGTVQIYT
jgi:DNA repair protein SbcC/Rad50